jgi:predicted HicB family RNase H-like nuclease
MTIQVQLNPETEARLIAAARAHGISVEEYAEGLLRDAIGS